MTFIRTVLVALACLIGASGAFAQGKWTKLAAFPEPAEELLGASANGKMYVFCGYAPGFKPLGMVYEYDPTTDKLAKKKPMALARLDADSAQSCCCRFGERKGLRHRRTARRSVHESRGQQQRRCRRGLRPGNGFVEQGIGADADSA